MVSYTTLTTLALAALASCSPTARSLGARQDSGTCSPGDSVNVQLIGAADALYYVSVPCDNTYTATDNPLSISHVVSDSGPCVLFGVDGTNLYQDAGEQDFGPPQSVVGIQCGF